MTDFYKYRMSKYGKKEEWILIFEKAIGQDQQDRKDRVAFGRWSSRRRRKKSRQSCKSCLKINN